MRWQSRHGQAVSQRVLANCLMLLALLCPAITVHASGSHPTLQSMHMTPQLLYASLQCPLNSDARNEQSQWITSQTQLEQLYAQFSAHILGAKKIKAPPVDFKSSGVVLLRMGQKHSGGYRLELPEQKLAVKEGVVQLRVNWIEPAPGAIVAQVITSPCLLVRVPLAAYHRLEVVDQEHHIRASLLR